MTHPAMVVPGAMDALQAVGATLGKALDENGALSPLTIELVNLRVSQINGCSTCLEGHAVSAKKLGETDERLFVVAGWRDAEGLPWQEIDLGMLARDPAFLQVGA
jgi:AhpD family alkylhydroperoxidase